MANEDLKIGIGNEEMQQLTAKKVKIVGVNTEDVISKDGKKIGKKVVCMAKHPDREDPVNISSVKHEKKTGQLAYTGLWLNLDSKGMIQKGSALAALMNKLNALKVEDINGKEAETVVGDKGYLTFKAY